MPCNIVSAASENDPHCIAVTAHRHQAATQLVDMRTIEASVLRKLLGSASFDFFLLAAGTPHMQLSRLASDKSGLEGRDSSLFWEFVRIKGLLKDIARDMSVRFFFLLENVVPTNVKDLKDMEVALDVAAVEVDSAQMGWHRRPRVWFANFGQPRCQHKFLDTRGKQTTLAIPAAARRLGPMGPIFRGRFFPRYLRESGTKQVPEVRFPCLTCPLRPGMIPRGLDRVGCLQDDWIYPAWHFERSALTWAGDCWQRPPLNSGRSSFTFHALTRSSRAYRIAPSSGNWPACACSATRGTSRWCAASAMGSSNLSASQSLQASSTQSPTLTRTSPLQTRTRSFGARPSKISWTPTSGTSRSRLRRWHGRSVTFLIPQTRTLSWRGPLNKGYTLEGSTSRRSRSFLGMEPPQHRQIGRLGSTRHATAGRA